MPKTKRGIYHNLKESKYAISNSEIAFFFSSMFYLRKFLKEYKENRQKFVERFERITINNPLNVETLADIELYKAIEKRGFRACLHGVDISYNDLHQYALRKMKQKESLEWYQIKNFNLKKRIELMKSGGIDG